MSSSSAQSNQVDQPQPQLSQPPHLQSAQPFTEADQPGSLEGQSLPQSDEVPLQSDQSLHPQANNPIHESDRTSLHTEQSFPQTVSQPVFKSDQLLPPPNLTHPQTNHPFPYGSKPVFPTGQPPPQSNHPHHQVGHSPSQTRGGPGACQTVVFNPDELQRLRLERIAKALKIIGGLQIAFGIAEVLLGFIAIVLQGWFSYFATPVWAGLVFFITTGMLSRNSARKKQVRTANLIMFILTASFAFALLSLSTFMAKAEDTTIYDEFLAEEYGKIRLRSVYSNVCNPGTLNQRDDDCKHTIVGRKIVDSVIGFVALIEGVLATIGASLCCSTMCPRCCGISTSGGATRAYYTTSTSGYQGNQMPDHKYAQVPQTMIADGKSASSTNRGFPRYGIKEGYSSVPPSHYASSGAISQKSQTRGYNDAISQKSQSMTQPKPASYYSPNYFSRGSRSIKAPVPEYL